MSNDLIKIRPVEEVVPAQPGQPGFAGMPGQPERWETVTTQVHEVYVAGVVQDGLVRDMFGNITPTYQSLRYATPSTSGSSLRVGGVYDAGLYLGYGTSIYIGADSTRTQTQLRYVPATPPVPAVPPVPGEPGYIRRSFNLGWNSGAFSVASASGAVRARFEVKAGSIGVVAGLSANPAGESYTTIDHGLGFNQGRVDVREGGTVVAANVTTHAAGDVFEIVRVSGAVSYFQNGQMLYRSLRPSFGEVWLDAALYSGDDAVLSPELGSYAGQGMDAALRPLLGDNDTFGGGMNGALHPLLVKAPQGMSGRLREMWVMAGRPGGRMQGGLCALEFGLPGQPDANAGGFWVPAYAIAQLRLLPSMLVGRSMVGTHGGADLSCRPLTGKASDHNYGEMVAEMAPLYGRGYWGERDLASAVSVMVMGEDALLERSAVIVMNERMSMGGVLVVEVLSGANAVQQWQISDLAQMSGELAAALIEAFWVSTPTSSAAWGPSEDNPGTLEPQDSSEAWALNASTGASSRYERYGFNSYAVIAGVAYGAKEQGIYALEGDSDDGAPVRASLNFGQLDFGTHALKSVPSAYVGVASSGSVYLRVDDGAQSFMYRVRRNDPQQRVQRFDLGRGLRASYFTFELYNEAGADFELDTVRFEVIPLSRRI